MNKIDTIAPTWAIPPYQEPLAITNASSKASLPTTSRESVRSSASGRRRTIPTSVMVHEAIKSQMLTARSSVSFIAIKRYIKQNYLAQNVDLNNRVHHIKRYIISALEKGKLLRSKGKGVSGSFRLPVNDFKGIPTPKKGVKKQSKTKLHARKPRATKKASVKVPKSKKGAIKRKNKQSS